MQPRVHPRARYFPALETTELVRPRKALSSVGKTIRIRKRVWKLLGFSSTTQEDESGVRIRSTKGQVHLRGGLPDAFVFLIPVMREASSMPAFLPFVLDGYFPGNFLE